MEMIYVTYEVYTALWFCLITAWFLFACACVMDGIFEEHAEAQRHLAQWQKDYNERTK
jgi:hypothetical protein